MPGSVWAADYTDLLATLDGHFAKVLVVRDLASGCQLLALPVEHATAEVAATALLALFATHGAPLVLKTDNGSHLIGRPVIKLLDTWNVTLLRSPPAAPRYNGAVEAGIGSLKARLHHIAAAHGRAGSPTCCDLEQARLESNVHARPWGRAGPRPEQRWQQRPPVTMEQREALEAVVCAAECVEADKLLGRRGGSSAASADPAATDTASRSVGVIDLNATDRATVARRSIRRALIECGYLTTRRTVNSSAQSNASLSEN